MENIQVYKIIIYRFMINILQMIRSFARAVPLGVGSGAITLFLIKMYQFRTGNVIKKKKRNAIILLVSYITMMIQMAILFRPWGTIHEIDVIPFDTYGGVRYIILYATANAIIFLPLGILLPMIWKKMNSLKWILFTGFWGSLFIEMSQFVLQCGVVQTEDLIMNTAGAGIGYWIYKRWNVKERK